MAKAKKVEPRVQRFRLRDLRPAEYNPRMITPEAMDGLSASIRKFGCVEPIVVNVRGGRNIIIGGHQRYNVLLQLHGKNYQCICTAVSLNKTDEKLLNITLNNPKIQGEFIEELGQYIDKLQEELLDDPALLDLKINQLRNEVESKGCIYKEESLKAFKKTHILLSFPPALFSQVQEHLLPIVKIEGVEYEQGSN